MNITENKKFLEFIDGLLPKDGGIYYNDSKEDIHFYFYTGMNVQIKIFCMGDAINFEFSNDKEKRECSINIPFVEAEPLLDKLLNTYQKYHTNQHLINSVVSVKKEDFNYVKNYLKNNDLENVIKNNPDEYKLHLKNEKNTYDLIIKRVLTYNDEKRKINNLELLKIPMVTKDGSGKHAYCEFIIPGWKLHDFKAYSSVLYNDLSSINENGFILKLKEVSVPLANLYVYRGLDEQLPEKNNTTKNMKI